ncbi:MAG: Ig-like domain repeat protein [Methanobrevibacter sp.]|nr:Ig-like domain repeat protein [Methanobrevibacter sp.]
MYDDNSNSIITTSKLSFVLSNGTIIDAIFDENALLTADYLFTQNDTYEVSVKYDSLNNCKIYTGIVEVYSQAPEPELIIDIEGAVDGEPTVIPIELPSLASGNITIIVDGIEYKFGTTAHLVLDNLTAGNHSLVIIYSGDSIYGPVVKNMSFIVNDKNQTPVVDKIPTDIVASDFNGYAIDYKAGERGKYFTVTLKDSNGNPLANKILSLTLDGKTYSVATDNNGIAKLQISLQKAGNYKITISFSGDDQYKGSSAVKMIKIIKKKTMIKAKNKKFKASKKIKKITVTLKTIKGSSVNGKKYLKSGKKLTLKVRGKTYKAKINKKGKATFKIKKLNKRGTFKAKIRFKGDSIYKSSSKTIKIKIK